MTLKAAARLSAYILIILFGIAWMYMLAFGTRTTVVTEEQVVDEGGGQRTIPSEVHSYRQPQPIALVPLVGLMLIAIGLTVDIAMPVAWLSLALMTVLSAPLVFIIGLFMLAMAAALAAPLSVIQSQINRTNRWLVAGGLGAAILMVEGGWLLRGSSLGIAMLAVGLLMTVVLVATGLGSRPKAHSG